MILYHFHTSPFARRLRLIMAMKGLSAELRDPRKEEKWWPDLHRLNPLQTVPTLVDGERVLTDSLAIAAYFEKLVPQPSIWPDDMAEGLEWVRLTDRAIDTYINAGQHFYPAPSEGKAKMLGRAQGALDYIARKIEARGKAEYLVGDRWSLADIAVVVLGLWLEAMPARAVSFDIARQIVDLGWKVPPALEAWTNARKGRADVAELIA